MALYDFSSQHVVCGLHLRLQSFKSFKAFVTVKLITEVLRADDQKQMKLGTDVDNGRLNTHLSLRCEVCLCSLHSWWAVFCSHFSFVYAPSFWRDSKEGELVSAFCATATALWPAAADDVTLELFEDFKEIKSSALYAFFSP